MKLKNIIFLCAVILLLFAWGYYFYQKGRVTEDFKSFLTNYSQFNEFKKIWTSPLTYRVSLDSEEVGYLVFESEVGYQSSIEVATLVDITGHIKDVRTYRQDETPQFYKRLIDQNFFNQFRELPVQSGVETGVNIDAVSHATISSNAATKASYEGISFIGRHFLDINVDIRYNNFKIGFAEIAVLSMFFMVFWAHKKKNRKIRIIVLIYTVIILGFKFSLFISYSYFFSFLTGNWPSVVDDLKRYLIFFGSITLVLVTGKNLYCSYICPFGAFQELTNRIAKLPALPVSSALKKAQAVFPGLLAYIALVLALLTGQSSTTNYEPFSLLYGGIGTDLQWVLLPVTLFMALFVMRFYCNAGCPVGFVFNTIVKYRRKVTGLWKRKV